MSKKTSLKNLISFVVLLILFILVAYEASFFIKSHNVTEKPSNSLSPFWDSNYPEETAHWKDEINKLGTEKAYELFKQDTASKDFATAHTLAHVFGALIYLKEGVGGVVYCDAAFAYGCYHSFFGAAVTAKGPGIVPDLADACLKRWGNNLGCPHGIGHGLLGYMGDDKIVDALKICDTLPWTSPYGGCQSGVFMEYNFHTMQSVTGEENREYDQKNPYYPCNSLPNEFRNTCYFEQPQWWLRIFPTDYKQVGVFCDGIKDSQQRDACFSGTGNIVAPGASYDVAQSIALCSVMPNEQGVALCLERASWALYAEPSAKERAYKVCDGLSDKEKIQCAPKADFVQK